MVASRSGISYLNERQVADDAAAGRLEQVLDDWTPPYPGLCLYYPGRRNIPAKLRRLVDLIHEIRQSSDVESSS
ncbi:MULTISPECIES: LysR substrate-binding domain-containing protein [Rhizobium]|uniref:LysR substrate-binding domain-containing protein n=1 Tax=Rhizobium TaxID=379 RepID=UPI002180A6FF|nr:MULTISPECIES: LysR substrate-binding domain-containing protein [Rhizobium]